MSSLKLQAARRAVELVEDGMVLGLGTGSTTRLAVDEIGKLVRDGYRLVGVPTSIETERQARSLNIPLSTLEKVGQIDLTIDGADEVDPCLRLIKGLGGALLREKMVAYYSKREVIIVDGSKVVDVLGVRTPLPVEVVQLNVVILPSLLAEVTDWPGAVRSGLMRPSRVQPRLEKPAIRCALAPAWPAATLSPFLAVEGLPTILVRLELPAAHTIRKSRFDHAIASSSADTAE